MKTGDIWIGVGGTMTTLTLINTVLGTIAGVLTIALLALRLHREWKKRNVVWMIGEDGKPKTKMLTQAESTTT